MNKNKTRCTGADEVRIKIPADEIAEEFLRSVSGLAKRWECTETEAASRVLNAGLKRFFSDPKGVIHQSGRNTRKTVSKKGKA